MAARAFIRRRTHRRASGPGRAMRAASGRIQGADPEDVGQDLRDGHVQARRNFVVQVRRSCTARAPVSAIRTPARGAPRRCGGCSARPDRRPLATTRGARMFCGSYFNATAKCVGFDDHHVRRRHLVHHAAPRHRLLHLADALLGLRAAVGLLGLVAHFLARHAQRALELEQLQRNVDGRRPARATRTATRTPRRAVPRRGRSPRAAPCARARARRANSHAHDARAHAARPPRT